VYLDSDNEKSGVRKENNKAGLEGNARLALLKNKGVGGEEENLSSCEGGLQKIIATQKRIFVIQ